MGYNILEDIDKLKLQVTQKREQLGKDHTNLDIVRTNMVDYSETISKIKSSLREFKRPSFIFNNQLKSFESLFDPFFTQIKDFKFSVLSTRSWNWDPKRIHQSFTLNAELTQITKKAGAQQGYYIALGDKILDRGNHEWKIKIKNVSGNGWISIGVCPSSLLGKIANDNYNSTIYGSCYSITTQAQIHNGTFNSSRNLKNGEIVTLKLNMDVGTLEFYLENNLIAKCLPGKNVSVIPICILYYENNQVELVD